MGHPVLYRKRFMPQETILLRDDIFKLGYLIEIYGGCSWSF